MSPWEAALNEKAYRWHLWWAWHPVWVYHGDGLKTFTLFEYVWRKPEIGTDGKTRWVYDLAD